MRDNPLTLIYDFTFHLEPDVRILFLTMLMRCDEDGEVSVSKPILADNAGLSLLRFEAALKELMAIQAGDVPYPRVIPTPKVDRNTYTVNNYHFYRDDLISKCHREWARTYQASRRKR